MRFKWGALPGEQREAIKTYVSNLIIAHATDEARFRRERRFVGKLNMVLVQILKQARGGGGGIESALFPPFLFAFL